MTGGVPRYIREFQKCGEIHALIRERVLDPNSFLFDEPRFLLQREVEDIGSCFSILRVIAAGNHRLSGIAAALRQKQTNLPRYLHPGIHAGTAKNRKDAPRCAAGRINNEGGHGKIAVPLVL